MGNASKIYVNIEIVILVTKIRGNKKLEFLLKRIQSRFRGLISRKRVKAAFMKPTMNDPYGNYVLVNSSKITEDEIRELTSRYSPLKDGIHVVLRQSVEYENKAVYYGEW